MSTLVTFNSTGYLIPNAGETGWGPVVTSFLTDVGNNALTLAGTQTVTNKTIRLSAGTAAAPAIAFAGDATTGVYMPTSGQIALSTGGVQRLLIDSAGLITTSGTIHATTLTATTMTATGTISGANLFATLIQTNAGSSGSAALLPGDSTHAGYLQFANAAGTQQFIMGGNTAGGAISMNAVNGATGFSILGAVNVTGAIGCTTTISSSGAISSLGAITSRAASGGASLNSDGVGRGYAAFANASNVMQGYIGYINGTSIDIATSGSTTAIRCVATTTSTSGIFQAGGDVAAGWSGASGGYVCKGGLTGGFSGNRFNFFWSGGSLFAYVDDTNIGAVQVTSDVRYKHSITPMEENAVDRMLQLQPISYRFKDKGIFKDDNVSREGFIAQDLKKVIPSAVVGDEDSDNPMSLNVIPIVAVLTKAIQELTDRIATLEAR